MNLLASASLCAALCGAVFFVRRLDGTAAKLISVTLCVFISAAVYAGVKEPLQYINEISQSTPLSKYMPYVLKSVAICFVCKTCRDLCDQFGEPSIGSQIDMAGKISILTVCLPLVKEILSLALGYLN